MNLILETERLVVRKIELIDAREMFAMDSNPRVHTFLGNNPVSSLEETSQQIIQIQQQYQDYNVGRWAVALKETNMFIGWTGFKWMTGPLNAHNNFYDFGYRLQHEHWGKGFATEAGTAALHYGLHTLGLKPVFATTDPGNFSSRRVLEKIGFVYAGTFPYDGQSPWRPIGEPTIWYALKGF